MIKKSGEKGLEKRRVKSGEKIRKKSKKQWEKSREKSPEKSGDKNLKAREKSRKEKSSIKFAWHLLGSVVRDQYQLVSLF